MGAAFAVEFSWFSADPFVRNGTAWDKCDPVVLDASIKKINLPLYGFEVRRQEMSQNPREILIFMEKRLSYMGHPPGWMSITGERSKMHVASAKETDGEISFGLRGVWSTIEGGKSMTALMIVHPDLQDVEICHLLRLTVPETRNNKAEQKRSRKIFAEQIDVPWKEDSRIFQVIPWRYDYSKTAQGCQPAMPPNPY